MTRHLPLHYLLERAQQELDQAARQLGRVQREQAEAQQQLDALLRYRDEYQAGFTQRARLQGMPAGNWRNFQAFVDTLDAAIGQQRRVLEAARARVEAAHPEWQAKKRTHGAYETLIAREAAQTARLAARREQRDTDEFAANAARMRALLAG
jgi:flagellar protein FliJ